MNRNTQKNTIIGTGLSGLVGSRIVELLKDRYTFSNLDLSTGVDITRENIVKKAIEKASGEVLIHMAAYTDVDTAHEQKEDKNGLCYKINVLGTRYVAQYCKEFSKYLIHISTDFIFDGKKTGSYTENDIPNPIEWYGKTKYLAEQEIKKVDGEYAIIRIAFPFRANFPGKLDVVRSIIKKLETNTLHPMFSDQTITPTFIDDIAQALDIIIQKRPKGIYHLVGSTPLSPYLLAIKIAKTFGFDEKSIKEGRLEKYLETAERPYQLNSSLSNRKIQKELGIKMLTIDQALLEMKKQIKK